MIRKLLLSAFAFSAIVAVEARPVDPLDLEKVNAYIEKELKEKGHDVLVKVTRGDLDDVAGPNGTEELVTGGRVEVRWEEANPDPMEAGSGFMDLALYQDPSSGKSQVSAAAGFSLVLQNPREIYLQFEETVKNVIDNVNKNGFYHLELNKTETETGNVEVEVVLTPVSPEAVSILSGKITGSFPNLENGSMSLEGKGVFSLVSALISNAQVSLTKVFNALKVQREPTEQEYKGLEELFETILKELALVEE
jgi:hypothetical protein